mmetsp:Transcript_64480/g.135296  ORF Transcript_64480/g.135296 Transcript_64480/m.135296 type:complete len:123 (+) Transcript_64480:130-498(+)
MGDCCSSERRRTTAIRFNDERTQVVETPNMTAKEKTEVLRRASLQKTPPSEPSHEQAASQALSPEERARASKVKGARLLKAGLKSGEVSRIVDMHESAQQSKRASQTPAPARPVKEEELVEY